MEHKEAYLVVLCCMLMHMTYLGWDNLFHHVAFMPTILVSFFSQAVAYLLYPLLGWLADIYFTRYKFILFSFITMIVGNILMITSAVFFICRLSGYSDTAFAGLALAVGLIGMGSFESTAIQFGMDQMLEASSDQISTFIHWYYWGSNVGTALFLVAQDGVLGYLKHCTVSLKNLHPTTVQNGTSDSGIVIFCTSLFVVSVVHLMSVCVGLCLLIYYKKHFNIDQTGEHPLKLIYQVLKYAWKHKCPENRSAFTYWEEDIPPRIDLGKNKYGGPFTTEEVEDTKSFFSILVLLLSLFGFHLSGYGYSFMGQLMQKQCPSPWAWVLSEPLFMGLLVVIIGTPISQFSKKHCPKYHPNMLKKMGIGLLCCLVTEIALVCIQFTMTGEGHCRHFDDNLFVSCYYLDSEFIINNTCLTISNATDNLYHCKENNTPFLLLMIPNTLHGLSFLLVFMTALEFICAQAPLRLKGLLIGIWYSLLAINYLLVKLPDFFIINYNTVWIIFQEVKAFIIFLSLMIFLCVSRRYRYRVRDEVVNEQFLVEEIYERELSRVAESDDDNSDETSVLVESVQEQGPCYDATGSMRCRDH